MAKAAGGLSLAVMHEFKHACAICIALAFFLFIVFVDWDPIFQGRSISTSAAYSEVHSATGHDSSHRSDWPDWVQESPPLKAVMENIRATREVASDGSSVELTAKQKEEWHRQNPCRSRSELLPMYERRKSINPLPPDPRLDFVLAEYSKLHRACMQKLELDGRKVRIYQIDPDNRYSLLLSLLSAFRVTFMMSVTFWSIHSTYLFRKVGPNITEFFISNKTLPGCKFVVGSPMYGTGLGNKLIVTISALLYAVLTQRILLVPTRTNIPGFLCEPFIGSSWSLDSSTFPFPDGARGELPWEGGQIESQEWPLDKAFFQAVDDWISQEKTKSGISVTASMNLTDLHPPALAHAFSVTVRWQPSNRFYCRTEQRMVDEVPWLYWGGCIYSIPKMFGSPNFGPALNALFPDRMIMSRALRSAILPADRVFEKFLEENSKYFKVTDRRVGIQLRNRLGKDYFMRMNMTLSKRILDCAIEHNVLPNVSSSGGEGMEASAFHTKIYIASLYRNLLEYLNEFYGGQKTVTGEDVEVVQISMREEQQLGAEEDIQAFVEILLLSLSDHLLVTPSSTFGSIAQGYGAMTPWFFEPREDTSEQTFGSCVRAQSNDICHQFTSLKHECPHDPSMDNKYILDSDPSLKSCMAVDHEGGFQLISTFQSDKYG